MTWFQGRFVIENPGNVGYRGRDNLTLLYGGFHKWGIPEMVGWFIREYPIKMDDLGVPSKATYIISLYEVSTCPKSQMGCAETLHRCRQMSSWNSSCGANVQPRRWINMDTLWLFNIAMENGP